MDIRSFFISPPAIILTTTLVCTFVGLIGAWATYKEKKNSTHTSDSLFVQIEKLQKETITLSTENETLKRLSGYQVEIIESQKKQILDLQEMASDVSEITNPISPLNVKFSVRYRISDKTFEDFNRFAKKYYKPLETLKTEEIRNIILESKNQYLIDAVQGHHLYEFFFISPEDKDNGIRYSVFGSTYAFKFEKRGYSYNHDGGAAYKNDGSYTLEIELEYNLNRPMPIQPLHTPFKRYTRTDIHNFELQISRTYFEQTSEEYLPYFGQTTKLKFPNSELITISTFAGVIAKGEYRTRFTPSITNKKSPNEDKNFTTLTWTLQNWDISQK